MASERELKYIISLTTEGKPELVEATEELEQQNRVVLSAREGLSNLTKVYSNVNELTEVARANFHANSGVVQELASATGRLSEAERNLEMILSEANERLQENSFQLEAARLEYETGAISQETYTQRLRELRDEVESIDAPSVNLIRRQREINREIDKLNPGLQVSRRQMGSANSALFTMTGALTRLNPQLGTGVNQVLSMTRGLGQLAAQTGSVDGAFASLTRFALSPAGIISVLAMTATGVLLLMNYFRQVKDEIIDVETVSKGYVQQLQNIITSLNKVQGAGGPFDARAMQQNIDMLRIIRRDFEALPGISRNWTDILVLGTQKLFQAKDFLGLMTDQEKIANAMIREQSQIRGVINELLEEQLKIQAQQRVVYMLMEDDQVRALRRQELMLELDKHKSVELEKHRQAYRDMAANMDSMMDTELEFAISGLEDFLQESDRLFDHSTEKGREFLNFEGQLLQMRINQYRLAGDEIRAMELERDRSLREIESNRFISEEQREEGRLMVLENFRQRELDIERQTAEERKRIYESGMMEVAQWDEYIHDLRINNAMLAANTLQAINQGFFEDNKGLNILTFAAEKVVSIAAVLLDTQRRAAQARMTAHALLASPATAPLAANAFAQEVAIRTHGARTAAMMGAMALAEGASKFGSGGSGGGSGSGSRQNPMVNFRGIDSNAVNQQPGVTIPDRVKLISSRGVLLTELEYERDAAGESAYLGE